MWIRLRKGSNLSSLHSFRSRCVSPTANLHPDGQTQELNQMSQNDKIVPKCALQSTKKFPHVFEVLNTKSPFHPPKSCYLSKTSITYTQQLRAGGGTWQSMGWLEYGLASFRFREVGIYNSCSPEAKQALGTWWSGWLSPDVFFVGWKKGCFFGGELRTWKKGWFLKILSCMVYDSYLALQATICKWLYQLDDSKSLHRKWLFDQTSILHWLFRVPGIHVYFKSWVTIKTAG